MSRYTFAAFPGVECTSYPLPSLQRVSNIWYTMCFGLSEQDIRDALENAKECFHRNTKEAADLTPAQCEKALNNAVSTLDQVKKKGQGALKKDLTLQDQIDAAYNGLKELQRLGPDKVQASLKFAEDWRYVSWIIVDQLDVRHLWRRSISCSTYTIIRT